MTMESITGDKYIDFVIQNYYDIVALNELFDRAKIKLPEWVNRHVRDAICSQMKPYFSDLDIECRAEDDEIKWFHKDFYDYKSGVGVYMGTEFYDWETLTAKTQDDANWLYLYCDTEKLKKKDAEQKIKAWQNHLDVDKNLFLKEIILGPLHDYNQNLAGYCLLNVVNIDTINAGKFPELLVEAVKKFTSALLPVLRNFRN